MELKQTLEQPPREFTEVEWDHLHSKAYSEGLEALSEEEKIYWWRSNIQTWDGFALRHETYKRGLLSDVEWANDVAWHELTFCDETVGESFTTKSMLQCIPLIFGR